MYDYDYDYDPCERHDDYNVFEENQLDLDRALEREEEYEDEPLDPEGDRGPNYEPDPDLDDLPSDAFEDWRDEPAEDDSALYGDPDIW